MTQTARQINPAATPPNGQISLALQFAASGPATHADFVIYLYELHGDDIVLSIDGEPRWRGRNAADPEHARTIKSAALERLLPPDDLG